MFRNCSSRSFLVVKFLAGSFKELENFERKREREMAVILCQLFTGKCCVQ